ncbi:MAG: glycine--tRNA ligase subunit alpha [Rickettsiales bacterium]
MPAPTFQDVIFRLQQFWAEKGCAILQPYHTEVGAGTLHPATALRAITENPWNVAYVQPSMRPADGRYGDNPNRLQHYFQFQVILKPSPDNIQALYLESLCRIGILPEEHDIRFVEDDWENPGVGAWGLGWEVWCDGMEVSQFTYMQQIGGVTLRPVPGELTYGLERLAMYVQGKENVYDVEYSPGVTYGAIFREDEKQFSGFNIEFADVGALLRQFADAETECNALIARGLPLPAYDFCLKAGHCLNLLDARAAIGATERAAYIGRIRRLAEQCCRAWSELRAAA